MHELSLAHSIGEIALGTARDQGKAWRVGAVRVRIGELAGVDADALRFCFEVVRGEWPETTGALLAIEQCPVQFRCRDCGWVYELTAEVEGCTSCGAVGRECISGRELEVFGVELLS